MAPGYRNQNRRQNRTIDHDTFEGLPVRHWRRDFVTVAPPPTQESNSSKNDVWAVELPHGMPKDYHLLPQHSQDLLRAARSGRIYKRPAPVEDDEADAEAGDKPEKKEDDPKDKGFQAKAWKQVPRHLEGPDTEYLAKRRKGLINAGSKPPPPVPTVTKATVKRIDAAGKEYVQDIVIPHGQQVEGELISQTEIPDPSAVRTDGLTVHPTPSRRKPVIRKKPKGPGRGRKKQPVAPTSVPQDGQLDGTGASVGEAGVVGPDGVKFENEETLPSLQNEDPEMADGSIAASENDDSDEGEDGEHGDEDEDSVDNQGSPSKAPRQESTSQAPLPPMDEIPNLASEDTRMSGVEFPPHPVINTIREGKSGSPLKNVAMSTSTLASPLEVSPVGSLAAPVSAFIPTDQAPDILEHVSTIEESMQQEIAETAPSTLPYPPSRPTLAEVEAAVEEQQEEEEEEDMLLDLVEGNNAYYTDSEVPEVSPIQAPTEIVAAAVEAGPVSREVALEAVPTQPEAPTSIEAPESLEPQSEPLKDAELDDDFPDLLGGLEKSLQKPIKLAPAEAALDIVGKLASPEKLSSPEKVSLPAKAASSEIIALVEKLASPEKATETETEVATENQVSPVEDPSKDE